MFYIYALLDPREPGPFKYGRFTFSHKPFYIGKGTGNRAAVHVRDAKRTTTNNKKLNKIRKILAAGLDVIVVRTNEQADEDAAFRFEAKLIKLIGRENLTNKTDGGDGLANPSKRTRELKAKAAAEWWNSLSAKEKKAHADRIRDNIASRTPEQRAQQIAKQKASWAAISEEEKRRRVQARLAKVDMRKVAQKANIKRKKTHAARVATGNTVAELNYRSWRDKILTALKPKRSELTRAMILSLLGICDAMVSRTLKRMMSEGLLKSYRKDKTPTLYYAKA